jgi:hypothetical protein
MPEDRMKVIAAKLLNLFGARGQHWIRGEESNGNGDYCLIGGMKELNLTHEMKTLQRAVREKTKHTSIAAFNDQHYWPTIKDFLCSYIRPKVKK